MEAYEVNAWIFLAAGLGGNCEVFTFRSIIPVADALNHAIPTERELQSAFKWLLIAGFLEKVDGGFIVSSRGRDLLDAASSSSDNIYAQWEYLEKEFVRLTN